MDEFLNLYAYTFGALPNPFRILPKPLQGVPEAPSGRFERCFKALPKTPQGASEAPRRDFGRVCEALRKSLHGIPEVPSMYFGRPCKVSEKPIRIKSENTDKSNKTVARRLPSPLESGCVRVKSVKPQSYRIHAHFGSGAHSSTFNSFIYV
jgi:hypothetical protein